MPTLVWDLHKKLYQLFLHFNFASAMAKARGVAVKKGGIQGWSVFSIFSCVFRFLTFLSETFALMFL